MLLSSSIRGKPEGPVLGADLRIARDEPLKT